MTKEVFFTYIDCDAGKHFLRSLQVDVCHSNDGFLDTKLRSLLLMELCCIQVGSIVRSRKYEPPHLMILGKVMMNLQSNQISLKTFCTVSVSYVQCNISTLEQTYFNVIVHTRPHRIHTVTYVISVHIYNQKKYSSTQYSHTIISHIRL